jgi:hypothetical protein
MVGLALAGGALGGLEAVLRSPALAARLWERLSASALRVGPIEAHIGHKTPEDVLLARAAVDYANALYTLGSVAAIVGIWAVLAGTWWLGCAWAARRAGYHSDGSRAGRANPLPAHPERQRALQQPRQARRFVPASSR